MILYIYIYIYIYLSVSKNKKSEEIVIFYTCLLPYLSDSIEKLITTESLCNKKSY